jgi:hypothetical protein
MKSALCFLIAAKRSEITGLRQLALTSALVDATGHLVHALQRERGLSNLYLASKGQRWSGERAAQATGRPYWMSPVVGEDFNDYMGRVGLFAASQALKATLAKSRRAREAPA